MTHRISEQITSAISTLNNNDYFKDYLNTIRQNMAITEDKYQTILQRIFLLFVVFELASRATIQEFSLGPIKINDLSLVQKLTPTIIAYLYSQMNAHIATRRLLREVHDVLIEKLFKPIYTNRLGFYLLPPSSFVVEDIFASVYERGISKYVREINLPFVTILIFSPIIFLIYAFYRCFTSFGYADPLVWCSMAASLMFMIHGFLFFVGYYEIAE